MVRKLYGCLLASFSCYFVSRARALGSDSRQRGRHAEPRKVATKSSRSTALASRNNTTELHVGIGTGAVEYDDPLGDTSGVPHAEDGTQISTAPMMPQHLAVLDVQRVGHVGKSRGGIMWINDPFSLGRRHYSAESPAILTELFQYRKSLFTTVSLTTDSVEVYESFLEGHGGGGDSFSSSRQREQRIIVVFHFNQR